MGVLIIPVDPDVEQRVMCQNKTRKELFNSQNITDVELFLQDHGRWLLELLNAMISHRKF